MPTLSRFSLGFASLAVAFVCASGCGKSYGTLSGTVKMDGKLVVSGTVMVALKDGTDSAQGAISADGTYKVEKAPYGLLQIAVISRDPGITAASKLSENATKKLEAKGWKAPPPVDNSKWFAIPDHYESTEKSGITVTMDQKNKKFDIEMKGPPPE
jgi:hypothetical protein